MKNVSGTRACRDLLQLVKSDSKSRGGSADKAWRRRGGGVAEGCLPHPVSDCVVVEMIEDIDEGQAAELRNSAVLEMKQLAAAARVRQVLLACLLASLHHQPPFLSAERRCLGSRNGFNNARGRRRQLWVRSRTGGC